MAHDYKQKRPKSGKPTPAWIWLFTGFAMGLIVAFVIYLNARPARDKIIPSPEAAEKGQSVDRLSKTEQKDPPPERRSFDFYTLLPELEVVVPDEPAEPVPEKVSPEVTLKSNKGGYILQAGSFQKLNQADSLKARLAMMGVEAHIQSVNANQDSWHRVRIGPTEDLHQLNKIRSKLRKKNVDTLLMRVK